MSRSVSNLFEKARDALEREGRRLENLAQVASDGPASFDHDGFEAIERALSYVVMGGVLEDMMRELPTALEADISSLHLERRHLPISFLVATEAAIFRKCGTDTITSLAARTDLVNVVLSHSQDPRPVPDLGELLNLADGSTIGEKNFIALWRLLDLNDDWMNHPNDRLLLREIREKRNDVAHWQVDPVEIGRKKKPSDLITMIERLISLLDHLNLHIMYWFEQMGTATVASSAASDQK